MKAMNTPAIKSESGRLPLAILLVMVALILVAAAAQGQEEPIADQPAIPTPQTAQQGQAAEQPQDLQNQGLPAQQQAPIDTQPAGQANQSNQQQLGPIDRTSAYRQQGTLEQNNLNQDATFTERSMMRQAPGQANQAGMAADRPGELGVYVVEGAGPGVVVARVTQGSAAAQAGLRTGDRLLQVNGQSVDDPLEVTRLIRSIPAGSAADLEIWREGEQHQLTATLQPLQREGRAYDDAGRDNAAGTNSSDLAQRTQRLEQQLAMVMQELQRLRQDMAQLRTAGGAAGAPGMANRPMAGGSQTRTNTIDQAQPNATDQTQSGQAEQQEPLDQPAATDADTDAFPF